jgi:hypothetical protein
MLGRIWRAIQDWAVTTTRRRRRAYLVFLLLLDASLLVMSAVNYFHHRHDAGHFDGFITCSWCLVAFANAFAFGGTPLRFHSITSWNQRAQIEFGKAYSELTKREQLIVRAETAREIREGVRPPDERDALLQRGGGTASFSGTEDRIAYLSGGVLGDVALIFVRANRYDTVSQCDCDDVDDDVRRNSAKRDSAVDGAG